MAIEYQKVPAYLRLAAELRRWIITEKLEPGAIMPSQTEVHERFGFTKAIARQALQALEREGIIVSSQGTPSKLARVPALDEGGADADQQGGFGAVMRRLDRIEDAMTALAQRLDRLEQAPPAGRPGRPAPRAAAPDQPAATR